MELNSVTSLASAFLVRLLLNDGPFKNCKLFLTFLKKNFTTIQEDERYEYLSTSNEEYLTVSFQ